MCLRKNIEKHLISVLLLEILAFLFYFNLEVNHEHE
jgi:hypothetical protein